MKMSLDNLNNARANFLDGHLEIKDDSVYNLNTKTYTVKGYKSEKFYKKFSKSCFLTTCNIVVLIIVITVTIINYSKFQESHDSQKSGVSNETKDFSRQIIINDGNKLWAYNIENQSLNIAYEAVSVIDSFEIHENGETFLSTFNNTSVITSSPYEHLMEHLTNLNIIFQEARIKSRGIAFDYLGGILYIVDESKGCLIVVDVRTKQYNILLSDLLQPVAVFVDSPEGIMFILQISHSVLKGNMNGENLIGVIEGSGISAFTVDYKRKRLFWVDDFIGIKSSDYNGENQFTIKTITSTIVDLLILDNQLFWMWQDHHDSSIHQLISCEIDKNSCVNRVMNPLKNLRAPLSIRRLVKPQEQYNTPKFSPCKLNESNCEHLCLVGPQGTHSCACKLGWQLNPDEKTCRESRDFILYASNSLVRGHILDGTKKTFIDVILPTKYYINSSKHIVSFDYDQGNDDLFFAEERCVYRMKLKQYEPQKLLFEFDSPSYHPINVVFDWLTKKLYYFRYEKYSASGYIRYYIKKYDLNNFENVGYFDCQTIIKSGIIIHPQKSYIYYAGKNNSVHVNGKLIRRISTSGSLSPILLNATSVDIDLRKPMAIDYQDNRLYWIEKNTSPLVIKQSDLDGLDVHEMTVDNIPPVERILVYRQWIYLADNTTVWRAYKKNGKGGIKVLSIPTNNTNRIIIEDLKLISDTT